MTHVLPWAGTPHELQMMFKPILPKRKIFGANRKSRPKKLSRRDIDWNGDRRQLRGEKNEPILVFYYDTPRRLDLRKVRRMVGSQTQTPLPMKERGEIRCCHFLFGINFGLNQVLQKGCIFHHLILMLHGVGICRTSYTQRCVQMRLKGRTWIPPGKWRRLRRWKTWCWQLAMLCSVARLRCIPWAWEAMGRGSVR